MKTLTPLLCILSLTLPLSLVSAQGLYKWVDARGNTQYGDKPPANVNAKAIQLPKITVIENYAEQWKPLNFDEPSSATKPEPQKEQTVSQTYTKLAFLAPKSNQAIRANDGDISAMVSIKPPLKKGHQLLFSIDGKSLEKTTARIKNFKNLGRGQHSINVKVVDGKGNALKSSSVSFNVLRANTLNKNNSNQANKVQQARTFQNARQQQTQNNTQSSVTR